MGQAKASKEDADALRTVLEELRKERDEAMKASRSLRETVASLRNQVEVSLEDREKTIVSHISETSRLRDELRTYRRQNDDLSKRLEASTFALRKSETEMKSSRKRHEDKYQRLKEEQASDYAAFIDSEIVRDKLATENEQLQKELGEKRAEAERLDEELGTTRREKEHVLRTAQTKAERHYAEKREAERG